MRLSPLEREREKKRTSKSTNTNIINTTNIIVNYLKDKNQIKFKKITTITIFTLD